MERQREASGTLGSRPINASVSDKRKGEVALPLPPLCRGLWQGHSIGGSNATKSTFNNAAPAHLFINAVRFAGSYVQQLLHAKTQLAGLADHSRTENIMEMKPAQKIQYRHKLTGDDVRDWAPLTWRGFWLPVILLMVVTVVLLVADSLCN